jgi:hypothetical protein
VRSHRIPYNLNMSRSIRKRVKDLALPQSLKAIFTRSRPPSLEPGTAQADNDRSDRYTQISSPPAESEAISSIPVVSEHPPATDDDYSVIFGAPSPSIPPTLVQHLNTWGKRLIPIVSALNDCSGMFPPLKTAAAGTLVLYNIYSVCLRLLYEAHFPQYHDSVNRV